MRQFWMVWSPTGNPPRVKHDSEGRATVEAERLARANPGDTFIVLEAIAARVVENMQRIDLRQGEGCEPPF